MKVGMFKVFSKVTGQRVAPEARNAWERRHLAQCHSVIFPRRCEILGIAVVRPATCPQSQPGGLPDISRGLSAAERSDTPGRRCNRTAPRRGARTVGIFRERDTNDQPSDALSYKPECLSHSGTPPGCRTIADESGAVAVAQPRLISGSPPG